MNILCMDQRSEEWYAARCGRVTSSRVASAIAMLKRKDGEAAVRKTLKSEILAEMLTGECVDHYVSADMEWGTQTEPLARTAYEFKHDADVRLVGFVQHPTIERAGASPDGLVGKDGLIEIKCPKTVTHLEYMLSEVAPDEYIPQMQWQMACTGRNWCDFVSFDPRMPSYLQLYVVRVPRDEAVIAGMELQVIQFLKEVDAILERLPKAEMVTA